MTVLKRLMVVAALALAAPIANSAIINTPVPDSLIIQHNGFDWAWAGPCSPVSPSCGLPDMALRGAEGWRIPVASEWLLYPSAADFGPQSGFKCASAYFSFIHSHCDYGDALINHIYGVPNSFGAFAATVEFFAIRDRVAVSEASTLALLGLGLLGLGLAGRRKIA